MMITNSFGSTCKEMRSSAVFVRLYTFVTLSNKITVYSIANPVVSFCDLLGQVAGKLGQLKAGNTKVYYWAN